MTIQQAFGKAIRAIGIAEYAAQVKMLRADAQRAIRPQYNPTQETLNRLPAPFRLRLSLGPLSTLRRRRTA